MESDFQKVKTLHFRAFVPEELQSVERQDVLRTVSGNEILKEKRIKKSQMDIANMSRLFAFQIVLLENLNGIEVRRIGQIGQIGGIGRINAGELIASITEASRRDAETWCRLFPVTPLRSITG